MEIRHAEWSDLDRILEIYAAARAFMAAHGNPTQWGTTFPPREYVEDDIRSRRNYVCEENGRVCAVFFYKVHETDDDPDYPGIFDGSWTAPRPYGVVHRIASDGSVKGAGAFCIETAYSWHRNLRIDTHPDNVVMQNLLTKLGFTKCGKIIYGGDGTLRYAYQKTEGDKKTE